MERLRFTDKKILVLSALLVITAMLASTQSVSLLILHNIPATCYCILIIMWAISIRLRILEPPVRRRMLTACFFMLFLFFLRICKFSFFPESVWINEILWYSYYIPMTAIPLSVFMASLHMEPEEHPERVARLERVLIFFELVISAVVMTNYYHEAVFRISVHPDKEFTHNWFYFVTLGWMVLLGVGSVFLMFRKCILSASKKLWYIPALFIVFGCALLLWYLINGGAPKIAGHKLFHLQEAYCLPFIAGMESMLLIGLVPANSGYARLFDDSGINACIFDEAGKAVIAAKNWTEEEGNEDHRRRSERVRGGSVSWIEDVSAVNGLNREIEEITESLEDENDLIRQENELRAERVSYETRNRLYNRIATAVRSRALRVNSLLSKKEEDEESFRDDMVYAAVLSAYIKRMGNLMLLTDGNEGLDSEELKLSLGESLEYLKLKGCMTVLDCSGSVRMSARAGLLIYELFQTILEDVWSRLHSCVIVMECGEGWDISLAFDAEAGSITSAWKDREMKHAGAKLKVWYEDDTYYAKICGEAV